LGATAANSAETPPRSSAPVSTEDRSGVGASSDGQDERSRIVLPPETGEQPSLSSGLSDAPWLDGTRTIVSRQAGPHSVLLSAQSNSQPFARHVRRRCVRYYVYYGTTTELLRNDAISGSVITTEPSREQRDTNAVRCSWVRFVERTTPLDAMRRNILHAAEAPLWRIVARLRAARHACASACCANRGRRSDSRPSGGSASDGILDSAACQF
jgi:hypothetical protein